MTSEELYQVVGVRADNSRVIFCQGAMKSQAERARAALLRANVCIRVDIEPDKESAESKRAVPTAVVWT